MRALFYRAGGVCPRRLSLANHAQKHQWEGGHTVFKAKKKSYHGFIKARKSGIIVVSNPFVVRQSRVSNPFVASHVVLLHLRTPIDNPTRTRRRRTPIPLPAVLSMLHRPIIKIVRFNSPKRRGTIHPITVIDQLHQSPNIMSHPKPKENSSKKNTHSPNRPRIIFKIPQTRITPPLHRIP